VDLGAGVLGIAVVAEVVQQNVVAQGTEQESCKHDAELVGIGSEAVLHNDPRRRGGRLPICRQPPSTQLHGLDAYVSSIP